MCVGTPCGAPACHDRVRLSDAYRDNKIEAMRGQRAQNQLEITKRVRPYAHARARGGSWVVTGREVRVGTVGICGADTTRLRQSACSELREQLRADLLEALVVGHAGCRFYWRRAPIDRAAVYRHAHLNADVGRGR